MKKAARVFSVVITIVFLLSFFACQSGKVSVEERVTYPYSMKEIFSDNGDERIVDIAMLGSHDSFSDKITKDSPLDVDGTASYLGYKILGGLVKRISKAQKEDAYTQLTCGVRYFDVRISYYDGEYYTKHNKISAPLEDYITETIKFMLENKGEVVIFDMQHVYLGEKTNKEFFSALYNIRYDGASLFDFVSYETVGEKCRQLKDLTYDDVTNKGNKSGVVVLFNGIPKEEQFLNQFYYRDASIRSNWHNKNSESDMFEGIDKEYEFLTENYDAYKDMLRVNQAQMTAQFNLSVLSADLLKYADEFNYKQLQRESFSDYLKVMPIFMVDNATTNYNDFNFDVMEIIATYNMELNNVL